ncbi:MAG TPA: TIGR01459 family HAD-type hydrolase [Rhizomicrobium sp.]|jgi:HAD superfamily hydrolase (TIGR01459 family)|nr:TIGR01459 family HAD-type hydrolase [Rhizomicrobium sp.]
MSAPRLISGLCEIAADHDALICDVWGVLHDGHRVFPAAAEALTRFRQERGPVILLTNAPRVPAEVAAQCASYGVPEGCYDAIVSSGGATREELERRSRKGTVPLYYIGPDRDLPMIAGLDISRTDIDDAEVALCIGLADDLNQTPDDYVDVLKAMRARSLTMLCANPDIKVLRGSRMVWCGGSLARDYELLGGRVVYYGKPHGAIYQAALGAAARAAEAAHRPCPQAPLAIGDGLFTDIKGANGAGLPALFIADGIHGDEVQPYNAGHLADLFRNNNVTAAVAARSLTW